MENLAIFNSEVIPVYTTDTSEKVVVGRELHEKLAISERYNDWFPRMCEYGFTENSDFSSFTENSVKPLGGRPTTNHIISLDMAKHIAMIQRTQIGMIIRQKLIDLEKQIAKPMSQLEIMRNIIDAQIQTESRISLLEVNNNRLENKIQSALETPCVVDWCKWINDKINFVIKTKGASYAVYRGDLYAELDQTAHCNLTARQTQMRRRMKEAGHKRSECQAISKLHVINNDPKLKTIFEGIVKREYARCS